MGTAHRRPPARFGATGLGAPFAARTNGVGCLRLENTLCFPSTDIQRRLCVQRRKALDALWPRRAGGWQPRLDMVGGRGVGGDDRLFGRGELVWKLFHEPRILRWAGVL